VPFKDRYSEGSWAGNDTIWRTILDLNRVLLYCDAEGQLHEDRQRQYLALVDGIVAGEGEGPLEPDPKPAGTILAGTDPVAVDCACASIMGFEYDRIPVISNGFESGLFGTTGAELVRIRSNNAAWRDLGALRANNLGFIPTMGWRGHIEIGQPGATEATTGRSPHTLSAR
jgi:hypothetical protein